MENILLTLHVLPSDFGSFLISPVLFLEQNMLDELMSRDSKIINAFGSAKRRSLSPADRGWTFENMIFFGTPLQGQNFC